MAAEAAPTALGSATIHECPQMVCRLSFYPPAVEQAVHAHEVPGISVLLSGGLRETVGAREEYPRETFLAVKPAGVRHSDCYGRDGATILSLKVHDTALWTASAAARDWGWSRLGAARVSEILRLLTSPSLGEPLAGVYELLASIGAGRPGRGTPPRWLREVSERLVEEPAVRLAQLSREAGVHPVYLSRAFRTWFGCSPKSYRLNRRTSAAIGVALTCRTRAADIAHDAAFADQSHMARSIKEMTGHSLTQLRAMLGHARPAAEPARRS